MTKKKIRDIVAKLYWQAHTNGRLKGENAMSVSDFKNSNDSIESAVIQLYEKPKRAKRKLP